MREIIEQVWNMPLSESLRLLVTMIAVVVIIAVTRQVRLVREVKKMRRRVEERIRYFEQS